MTNEKQIKARFQQKHDIEANWNLAVNFIPKAGEIIIYDPDANYNYSRLKIGDGVTSVNQLNFVIDENDNAVKYIEQTLTEEQQVQARTNIGAISMEEVEELLGIENEEEFSVTGEVVQLDLDIEPGTELNVVSKIQRDSTWGESNKLVLHQVSGDNFVDLSSYLGGAGKVFEKDGLTATINADGTLSVTGTNTSTGWTNVVNVGFYNTEHEKKVYPAGTYVIPSGLNLQVRKAEYPGNVSIEGLPVNVNGKVVIPEPFRIIMCFVAYKSGASVNDTIPLGLFRGDSVPDVGREYVGNIYTTTFDSDVYEGEYNWSTGELKDANGNTVAYYDPQPIKSLSGVNHFWTGFGENTVSNVSSENLGKVVIRLGDSAPEETVPSICDFTLTPATKNYAINVYGDSRYYFREDNVFHKLEVPLITTRGKFVVTNSDGLDECELPIPELINFSGITDTMTCNKVTKCWSDRFYITREPDFTETIDDGSGNTLYNPNTVATWVFSKKDFEKFGLPIEATDIPIVSPIFTMVTNDKLMSTSYHVAQSYAGAFSYNAENDNYVFKCRAQSFYAGAVYNLTKGYFCYPLKEEVHRDDNMLSLYLDAGYSVRFEQDDAFDVFWEYSLTQGFCPFYDESHKALWSTKPVDASVVAPLIDVTPNVGIFVPRSVEDALYEAEHIAKRLNYGERQLSDYELNSYQWIGAGDGTTDYTDKIQSKLTELHNTTKGGIIYLGPGTYPISRSLIVYDNTQIIGNGHTIIEQRADNTHAIIWNGSNIRMCDLTIKLAGVCSEVTACIFANSYNTASGNRDERYPENMYVQFCSTSNVTLVGTYNFSWSEGYPYLSDETLAYRGVGVHADKLYFNFYDCDGLTCRHLYAGLYGYGGSNNYRICVTESRYAVRGGGGNNIIDITGHTYYGFDLDGKIVSGTEYVFYGKYADTNKIMVGFYDPQYSRGIFYFDGSCKSNLYSVMASNSGLINGTTDYWETGFTVVTDYGRGNIDIQPYRESFVGVGSALYGISGQQVWNTQFNPSVHNALSGAGVWGTITSNKEWTINGGIGLSDVCRYPKDTLQTHFGLAAAICEATPSEESPIEIIIDISDRPVTNYKGFWIQFDHKYVAEKYTVSFDTNNDGIFNWLAVVQNGNNEPVSYSFNYQTESAMVYRIKISITKALQIPDFMYRDEAYNKYTVDYNPDGLVGIVNIGMPSNEVYGRAFLGECGGSLYGNVDMHQNTLKNLPDPVDAGDAVSKSYLENYVKAEIKSYVDEAILGGAW